MSFVFGSLHPDFHRNLFLVRICRGTGQPDFFKSYTPVPNYQGPDWLTISANDQGNSGSGGPLSDNKTVVINVGRF